MVAKPRTDQERKVRKVIRITYLFFLRIENESGFTSIALAKQVEFRSLFFESRAGYDCRINKELRKKGKVIFVLNDNWL